MNLRQSTFLIAPVRGFDSQHWAHIVHDLENNGWEVYWPARDTNQSDAIGLTICEANRDAIQHADAVHVIWDGVSHGCLFDLGIAFALKKPVYLIDVPPPTTDKSFQNMIRALCQTSTS